MRNSIRASLCAALISLLAACGGGGGNGGGFLPPTAGSAGPTAPATSPPDAAPPDAPPAAPANPETPATPVARTSFIKGKVTAKGDPVANATVRVGTQTVATDAQGHYRLQVTTADAFAVVVVKSAGHLTMAKQVVLAPEQAVQQDIAMQAVDVQRTFYAADGVIAIVNGAVIDIPKNAIKDASGGAYDGPVLLAASYRNPTTAAGIDAFPQPYQGDAGGTLVNLQTVGVIEATLSTPAGEPLQLRAQATLVYPGVSAIDRGAATIPLWHYDEARGLWVQEGRADRQSDGSYLGKVSHFSAWNLDVQWGGQYTGIDLEFCVNFADKSAGRHGIRLSLEGPGFLKVLDSRLLEPGNHSIRNLPAYTDLTLHIYDAGSGKTQTRTIAATSPGSTVALPACLSLVGTAVYVPLPLPSALTPAPADTPVSAFQGNLLSSRYATLSGDDQSGGWIDALVADANGVIVGSGFFATEERMKSLTGQMAVGGYFTLTATPQDDSQSSFIGPILLSGRVYVDPSKPGVRVVQGLWAYANWPSPTNATFQSP